MRSLQIFIRRYLHRLISSSITARGKSREWCMGGDLLFVYCLLYKRSCALAHDLAQYFTSAHHQQGRRQLYGNTYVNVIARSFGYHPSGDLHLLPAIRPRRLGRSSTWGMKVLMKFPVLGTRFCAKNEDIFVLVQLPTHFDLVATTTRGREGACTRY
ncbi:hypothetical protein Hanom_Chr14g01286801 [Helianthus anomalus]